MLCHHGVPHVALLGFFPLILEKLCREVSSSRVFPATACCLNVGLARLNLCHVLQHRPPFCQWNSQFLLSGWSCSSCLKILKWKRSYSVSLWCLCTFEHRRHRLDVVGSWCNLWTGDTFQGDPGRTDTIFSGSDHMPKWPHWDHRMRPGKSKPIRHYLKK